MTAVTEEWKVIEKATNYEISTCGRVTPLHLSIADLYNL